MRLTGISNRGLAVIAVLVAVLWGCIVAEKVIRRQAWEETVILLRSPGPFNRAPASYRAPKHNPRKQLLIQRNLKV
jgi:hypothetical protein